MNSTYHSELIDGLEIEKTIPDHLHAVIQTYLIVWFSNRLQSEYWTLPELNVIVNEDRIVPDIVITSGSASRFRDGDLTSPPILAVEIMSRRQMLSSAIDRAERLCAVEASTSVWIIWPKKRRAWEYTQDNGLTEARSGLSLPAPSLTILTGNDHLDLTEMWQEIDEIDKG